MRRIELPRPLRLFAPAKLNLGLEVVGRRPDGYHEVVTILQTVSLFDVIDLLPAARLSYEGSIATAERDDDLVWRALRLAHDEMGISLVASVRLEKHIPLAAGLGGGSSDAGTLLGAIATLGNLPRANVERAAATLGSDVPFFVRGGTALATGTGTELEPLPDATRAWFVVLVPSLEVPEKTRTLYAELQPSDFSDGRQTMRQVRRLALGRPISNTLLRNSFSRPLLERPAITLAAQALSSARAYMVVPSGAGPALFAQVLTVDEARRVAGMLDNNNHRAYVCTTVAAEVNAARLTRL